MNTFKEMKIGLICLFTAGSSVAFTLTASADGFESATVVVEIR